jgi:predicted lipid carrier protein YhbT
MASHTTPIPLLPSAVAFGLRPLPLAPLALALNAVVRSVAARHPSIFARLGAHADKRYLIEPTDLPFVLVLTPTQGHPAIEVERSRAGLAAEVRIAGPLAALLGLLHGAFDGDALFFSRDLAIEGDIEAVLALRNALDDAELDLVAEAAATLGPFAPPAERIGRLAAAAAEELTGVALTKPRSRG